MRDRKDYCVKKAFEDLKASLNMEQRKNDESYENTVKLLRLMNRFEK